MAYNETTKGVTMFRNRSITIKVNKEGDSTTTEAADDKSFENKTEVILRALEGIGAKMFLGVVVYVLLDTRRQVAIQNAIHNH
jgi:hypothetical protein